MTSSKPYLIRGLYQWLLDNEMTAYLLVDSSIEQVMIPEGTANDGKVVLNISPSAVQNLELANDHVSFSARFNGVAQNIYCPIHSILAIYARENGEGMMFPAESEDKADADGKEKSTDKMSRAAKAGLKIVK